VHRIVATEPFNPDPDIRYHRSLAEAFPSQGVHPHVLCTPDQGLAGQWRAAWQRARALLSGPADTQGE
jgi:hypothetical protein